MICPSGSFENVNDSVSMVFVWNAFVDEGSVIGTSAVLKKLESVIG